MFLLTLQRFKFSTDWTLGRLLVNDQLDGFTVEDEIRNAKVHGETAIPFGTYPLKTRQSPKFSSTFFWSEKTKKLIEAKDRAKFPQITDFKPHDLIWIDPVPGFEFILIHWGNTDLDTEGCLIVGKAIGVVKGREGVVQSRLYYKSLYERVYPLVKAGGQMIDIQKVAG